jgi:hypothetical protein
MERILQQMQAGGMGGGQQGDSPQVDNGEMVYISSLALLKMLKHGRAGVPMEVMGLMLGEFVDEYTVQIKDVFAMPQSGTGVSVEAVDPVFQTNMLEMLNKTGRREMVVGWYHSHPGFGCWSVHFLPPTLTHPALRRRNGCGSGMACDLCPPYIPFQLTLHFSVSPPPPPPRVC